MLLRADGQAPGTIRRADGVAVDKIIRADGTEIYVGLNILNTQTGRASVVSSFVYIDFFILTNYLSAIRRITIRRSNGQILLSGTPIVSFSRFILTDSDGTSITIARGGGATLVPFANQIINSERIQAAIVE